MHELFALFAGYGVTGEDRLRILELTKELGAVSGRAGRPRKYREGMSLGEFLRSSQKSKKRGRKPIWSDTRLRKYLKEVLDMQDSLRNQGRKATVKAALEEFIKQVAREDNLSELRTVRTHLHALESAISMAKRKFPELT